MVKIFAVQCEVLNNPLQNLENVDKWFELAAGCDFICFPECFLTGPEDCDTFNDKIPVLAKEKFAFLSEKYSIYAIMGSIHERKGDRLINVSYAFNRQGEIIGSYIKRKIVPRTEEVRDLICGESSFVFETEFGKVGVQICRDLLYPEITKEMVGAKIVFCPAFWSWKSKSYLDEMKKYRVNSDARVIDALVQARAFENCVAFIFVNAAGNFVNEKIENCEDYLAGHTQIALPLYGVVAHIKPRREECLIYDIDLSVIDDAKRAYLL